MKQSSVDREPKLDKPGAGLPFFDRLFLKFILGPIVAKNSSWDDNVSKLNNLNKKILEAVKGIEINQMMERRLVPSQKGLEDSSRFWSVAETIHKELSSQSLNRNSQARLTHPWFGPIEAHRWVWILMFHSGIHYKQIKEIKKQLTAH